MFCSQHEEKGAETGASARCFARSLNCEPAPERVCGSVSPSYIVIWHVTGYLRSEMV